MSLTPIVQDPVQADIDGAYATLVATSTFADEIQTPINDHSAELTDKSNLVIGFKNDAKTAMDDAAAAAALAHAAQIAKDVSDAENAKDDAETAKNTAVGLIGTASNEKTWAYIDSNYINKLAGVRSTNVDPPYDTVWGLVIPDGPPYLTSSGLLVASTAYGASYQAATYYTAARNSLDAYNMKLADYNNALAVPASDANKKSQADLDAMLADVNTAADSYNAAQLNAKASAQYAVEMSTFAATKAALYETVAANLETIRSYAASASAYFAAAQYDATNAASKPITVNLNIEIDAENNINVFGEKPIQPENVIVAKYKLPVDGLYDNANTKGLIEFWEPVDAQGDIRVELAHTALCGGENSYKDTAVKLVNQIERVLCDEIDCSGCKPFNDDKYDGISS